MSSGPAGLQNKTCFLPCVLRDTHDAAPYAGTDSRCQLFFFYTAAYLRFSDDRTQAPCFSHDLYDKILSNKFNILKNSILPGHHFSLADHAPDGIQFSGIAGNLFHKIYNTPE